MKKLQKILFTVIAGLFTAGIVSASLGEYWSTISHIIPRTDSTVDIGSNDKKVRAVWTDTFYGDYWISGTGNSMNVQPTGDTDDFFSFKTPADRPTIKREGGKYIYVESSNVNDVGISFRKDADHSGTVNYYKDTNEFGLTSKDPLVFKVSEDYDDYIKIVTAIGVPEMSTVGAADFKINAGGANNLLLNHAGGNVAVGATSTGYILGLGTGDTFGIGTTQWNSADEIDGTKIKDADYGDVVIDAAGDWQVSEASDLNCTDCINATEIEDIYLLNSGDTSTGVQIFNENIEMKDDKKLYFDTAKDFHLRYSSVHGYIIFPDSNTLSTEGDLGLYANTDVDANGTWEPSLILSDDGSVTLENTNQGVAGYKYFYIKMTDGIKLQTGSTKAIIKSDNVLSTDKTFQFPNYSGTFITSGNLTDITTVGTIGTGVWNGTALTDANVSNTLTVDGYMQDTDIDTFAKLQSWAVGYTDNDTTYVSSDFTHDDLTGFVANEHIDWTSDQGATNIHSGNYTDTNTQLSGEEVDDYVNLLLKDADSVNTRITLTYDDVNNAFDFVVDDMNDDVPDAGDFGAATDLDANGALNTGSVSDNEIDYATVNMDDMTNGSTNAAITLTQETNFETAYTHSQDNTQAHTDYFLNTGSDVAGAGAGFTWTFNASVGVDSVFTFGDGIVNLTTGALQIGGSAVLTGNESITLSGDITGSGATAITTTIGDDKILESMLKSVNAPTDEYALTYESTTGDFEWQSVAGGGDINDVFDCSTGDCNTMTVGTSEWLVYGTGFIDANRFAGVTTVDGTEFGYLNGVTSLIQTQFAGKEGTLTNSAGLLAALNDETGTGLSVFSTSPTFVTPLLGTPTSGVLTNCTGTASGLTAGNVTTNANLTGDITSVGNATTITADVITHADIADSDQADTKCLYLEDPVAEDDLKSIWRNSTANNFLITEIWGESDQTVSFDLQIDDGTPADVSGTDIAPAAGEAEDTSLAGDTTLAASEELDLIITSVSGTPTWVSICWTGNWVD